MKIRRCTVDENDGQLDSIAPCGAIESNCPSGIEIILWIFAKLCQISRWGHNCPLTSNHNFPEHHPISRRSGNDRIGIHITYRISNFEVAIVESNWITSLANWLTLVIWRVDAARPVAMASISRGSICRWIVKKMSHRAWLTECRLRLT